MSYEGWTNYETWAAKLWLDNEQGTYLEVTGEASQRFSDAQDNESEPDVYDFANWLKSYVEDMLPELDASLASDLLNAAFSEINWQEVAEAYLGDAKEEADH